MGHNTEYRLTWDDDSPTTEEVCAFIASTEYWNGCNDAVRDALQGQSVTWYHWEEDLKRLAANWPSVTFTMKDRGDDFEDAWAAFFRDNRSYQTRIEFPQPDENRLSGQKASSNPSREELVNLITAEEELNAALDQMAGAYRRARDLNRAAEETKRARNSRHDGMKRIVHYCTTGNYAPLEDADALNRTSNSPEDLRAEARATRDTASFLKRTGDR